MSKAFDKKIDSIAELKGAPREVALPALLKALKDRNNYLVSKAAALCGSMGLREAIPDLAAAFERFLHDAAKTDPQCWAKIATAKALRDLGHDDARIYLLGISHIQMEATYGGRVDTAAPLRGTCALALVACSLPRLEVLGHLVDLTGDLEAKVRSDAFLAMSQLPGADTELILRVKALAGDAAPEVLGQVFASLLGIATNAVAFVAGFLARRGDVAGEAFAALAACPEDSAIAAIKARLETEFDPELRRGAILALSASRLESARDLLLSLLESDRRHDRPHAREALATSRFRDDPSVAPLLRSN